MVFSGLTAAWRRASVPTNRWPERVKATTDGVVRPPSALAMTTGSPPSITATTLFVVPRSMPTVLAMGELPPGGFLLEGWGWQRPVPGRRTTAHYCGYLRAAHAKRGGRTAAGLRGGV